MNLFEKEIPFFKVGRLVRFHKDDLETWINDLRRKNQK